jgi:septum formation protein
MRTIILGSSSPYRRQLLERLKIPFTVDPPNIDETPLYNENPKDMVIRLTLEKAKSVAIRNKDALIISSDQCAVLNNKSIGKPKNYENAFSQLQMLSGEKIEYITGLCLYDSKNGNYQEDVKKCIVQYKKLSKETIKQYLEKEQPYNCAGSLKSEGLGIALLNSIESLDTTSLMGLPLIRLIEMLKKFNVEVLNN